MSFDRDRKEVLCDGCRMVGFKMATSCLSEKKRQIIVRGWTTLCDKDFCSLCSRKENGEDDEVTY